MRTKDGLELLSGIIGVFGAFGFAGYLLYGAGAAANPGNMTKFLFYGVLAALSFALLFVVIYLRNRGFFENNQELAGFNYITLHSPEQTFLGREFPNFTKAKVMIPFFFMVSMFFGALVSVSGQFATGTPELVTGSVSAGTSLGLAVEPAVSSETIFFNVGMLFIQTGALFYLFYNAGVSPSVSTVLAKIIAVLLTSIEFLLYHNFRYGAQETSQLSILLLGLITNSSTAATHSVIPAYLIHGSGNFFSKATTAGIFSNELSIVVAVFMLVLSGLVFLYFLFQEVL